MEPVDVVNAFIEAIGRKDMEATKALVADDCYYDNVPVGDMRGWEKMLDVLGPMFKSTEPVEFEVLRQTASGNMVMNERIDRFVMKGKQIAIPVAGVFEVNDDKITFWRDYFDNGMFMKALKGE
ncbi:MAG: nuclear transport factor 2 family protein [Acidimicrobiales bacterium]|nr:nuclear transport factor 2 family protein [Acidimicrobiales bacterium]